MSAKCKDIELLEREVKSIDDKMKRMVKHRRGAVKRIKKLRRLESEKTI